MVRNGGKGVGTEHCANPQAGYPPRSWDHLLVRSSNAKSLCESPERRPKGNVPNLN